MVTGKQIAGIVAVCAVVAGGLLYVDSKYSSLEGTYPGAPGDSWCDTGSAKRIDVNVDNSAGSALTDYQVYVNLTTNPINETSLRVYNITDCTLRPHWCENETGGNCYGVWINYSAVAGSAWTNNTAIYYDNNAASSVSNGTNTFMFFDDFNDGDYTNNPTWIVETGAWSATNNYLKSTASGHYFIRSPFTSSTSYIVDFKGLLWLTFHYTGTSNHYAVFHLGHFYKRVSGSYTQLKHFTENFNTEKNTIKVVVSGATTTVHFGTESQDDNTYNSGYIGFDGQLVGAGDWMDDIRVRKYVVVEPSTTLGNEEDALGTTPVISSIANGSLSSTSQHINWTINQTAHSRVLYSNESDLTPAYYSTWDNATAAPDITLSSLTASTQYWYQVWSYNVINNSLSANSSTLSFTTVVGYIPPNPTNLQSTSGGYWVNYTWDVGTPGNLTDMYNVSWNSIWYNETINMFMRKDGSSGAWANITVYAYNVSGMLSLGVVSDQTQLPSAAWCDTDSAKRKDVNVDNTAGSALTDYQVYVNLTTNPINETSLRVYNITDCTLRPHWCENETGGNCYGVWINYSAVAGSAWTNNTAIYYDNNAASSVSNGTNTFMFFDDFNDGDYTNNPTWTVETGAWSAADYYLKKTSAGGWDGITVPNTDAVAVWEYRAAVDVVSHFHFMASTNDSSTTSGYLSSLVKGSANEIYLARMSGGSYNLLTDAPQTYDGALHDVKITRDGSGNLETFYDGVSKLTHTDTDHSTSSYMHFRTAEMYASYIDDVRTRKYVVVEPSTTLGNEEDALGTTPVISSIANGSLSSTSQHINWTINQTAHSRVLYSNESDLTPAYYSTWDNATAAPDITLSSLTASTQYWYQVWSYNVINNSLSANSSTLSFTTVVGYIPPNPTNLQSTSGGYWVNYTWDVGTPGNLTDMYNVSWNSIWYNETINMFMRKDGSSGAWANITVYAYNVSGMLSLGVVSDQTQLPSAAWCDTDSAKRKDVNVDNTAGSALTDYQVYVNLTTNPINETSLRVYNITDCTLRPHWCENETGGNCYGVWINYSAVAGSAWTNNTAIYYDNNAASSVSNGTNTFMFFDDFNVNTINKAIAAEGGSKAGAGAIQAPNGNIIIAFENGYGIDAVNSTDNGSTWSAVYSLEDAAALRDSEPQFLVLGTDLYFFWCTIDESTPNRATKIYYKKSTDNGSAWGSPVEMHSDTHLFKTISNPIIMSNPSYSGRIVLPCYGIDSATGILYAGYLYSDDDCTTWHRGGDIKESWHVAESDIVELGNGTLWVTIRNESGGMKQYCSISTDGGGNWSSPVATTLDSPKTQAHLEKLQNGHIIVVWNDVASPIETPRTPFTVAVSYDNCSTWAYKKDIENQSGHQWSNFGMCSLSDGSIFVAYTDESFSSPMYRYIRTAKFSEEWISDTNDDFGTKWTTVGTPTVSVNNGYLDIYHVSGGPNNYIKSTNFTTTYGSIRAKERNYVATLYPIQFGFGYYSTPVSTSCVHFTTYADDMYCLLNENGTTCTLTSGYAVDDNYHTWDINWDSSKTQLFRDGAQVDADVTGSVPSTNLYIAIGNARDTNNADWRGTFDWILVRNHASPDPSSTLGNEDALSTTPAISNIQNGSISATSQYVNWMANQTADNVVIYDTGAAAATSTACAGQWSAAHACANASDGNWSSYAESAGGMLAYAYFNHTVPAGTSQPESLWHVKDNAGHANVTIPTACWGATLYLRAMGSDIGNSMTWQCDNGPGWTTLRSSVANHAYEEEMSFKYISTWDNATAAPNITLTSLTPSTGYNFYVRACNVTNSTLCSNSSVYTFTTAAGTSTNPVYACANEYVLVNNWSAAPETFVQIDANMTNDTAYSYYNGSTYIDYWSGYYFNNDTVVAKNDSCFIYFTADTTIDCVPHSGGVTIKNDVWHYTFLPGSVAKTLAEINASMVADGGDVWSLLRWVNSTESYNATGTVQPNEGVVVYANNTFVWTI